jgi:hypothetical protein
LVPIVCAAPGEWARDRGVPGQARHTGYRGTVSFITLATAH